NRALEQASTLQEKKKIKNEISDWQPILSDLKYDTDHTVYAKFFGKMNNGEFVWEGTQLYIQNYQGPVTIGFNSASVRIVEDRVPDDEKDIRNAGRKQFLMLVGLQGLTDDVNRLFKMGEDQFRNGKKITSPKLSEKPIRIKEGDTLRVESWFSPADPEITRIYKGREAVKDAMFVDELFMERMGEDVVLTWKGLRELEWISRNYPEVVSVAKVGKAARSRTRAQEDFIHTRDQEGDFRPCRKVYSIFYV
ncbi:MAG: hypothetical protein AAF696_38810, partial [Bacteroidota bacterium]